MRSSHASRDCGRRACRRSPRVSSHRGSGCSRSSRRRARGNDRAGPAGNYPHQRAARPLLLLLLYRRAVRRGMRRRATDAPIVASVTDADPSSPPSPATLLLESGRSSNTSERGGALRRGSASPEANRRPPRCGRSGPRSSLVRWSNVALAGRHRRRLESRRCWSRASSRDCSRGPPSRSLAASPGCSGRPTSRVFSVLFGRWEVAAPRPPSPSVEPDAGITLVLLLLVYPLLLVGPGSSATNPLTVAASVRGLLAAVGHGARVSARYGTFWAIVPLGACALTLAIVPVESAAPARARCLGRQGCSSCASSRSAESGAACFDASRSSGGRSARIRPHLRPGPGAQHRRAARGHRLLDPEARGSISSTARNA